MNVHTSLSKGEETRSRNLLPVLPVLVGVLPVFEDARGKSARTGVAIFVVASSRRNVIEDVREIAIRSLVLVPPVTTVQR